MHVLDSLLNKLNEQVSDSVHLDDDNDTVEVVVRKVVRNNKNDNYNADDIIINAGDNGPEVGNIVTMNGEPVEDGIYSFTNGDEEISCYVTDGKIAAIGDEAIEDLTKTMIRAGKVIKKKIPSIKKRLSAAQKQALVKARKKAQTGSAKKARLKSFKKGKAMGIYNSEEVDVTVDVSTVDLNALGDKLYEAVFTALSDRYELDEKTLDRLDNMLSDDICKPVVDGDTLKFIVPVWQEDSESVQLDSFDFAELVYELKGKFTEESLFKVLTDGDIQMQTSLIV